MIVEIGRLERNGQFAQAASICNRVLKMPEAMEYHEYARNILRIALEAAPEIAPPISSAVRCPNCNTIVIPTSEARCTSCQYLIDLQASDSTAPNHCPAYWHDKGVLIMRREAKLPPRCVGCNSSSDGGRSVPVRVRWFSPAYYIILVIGAILAILTATSSVAPNPEYAAGKVLGIASVIFLALSTSGEKKATVSVPLCSTHFNIYRKRRRIVRMLLVAVVGLPATSMSIVSLRKGASVAEALVWWLIAAALMLSLVFSLVLLGRILIWRWLRSPPFIRVRRIDEQFLWVLGACPDFLATLPTLPSVGQAVL